MDIKIERDKEYVETKDGRKIPFSALSSGQQELLPLLLMLGVIDARRRSKTSQLIYIEEPEAHLFPTAQSVLIQSLASIASARPKGTIYLIITTHSPYVLAKLNNLIKAGSLAEKSKNETTKKRIANVIPKSTWLSAGKVMAYAIINGKLVSILDNDGLVDAEYLDDVSGAIANEFSSLLEIEYSNDSK